MEPAESRTSAEFISFRDEIRRLIDKKLEAAMNQRALGRKRLFVSQAKILLNEEIVKISGLSRETLSDFLKPLGDETAEIQPAEEDAPLPFLAAFSRKIIPVEKMFSLLDGTMERRLQFDESLIIDHPLDNPPGQEAYLSFGIEGRLYNHTSLDQCIREQRNRKKFGLTIETGVAMAYLFPKMIPNFGAYFTGSRYGRADTILCIYKFQNTPILGFVESEHKIENALVFSCNRYSPQRKNRNIIHQTN
ncbi:MAG: hypothetical protein A2736_01695 [Candidatus Yanofskybacteria bacterium RIFCSPHIGHO2_01_FULL_41_27]|uniref:Uncharacterized protein n=2 Tax=Parcubacteria group TaxID=1794811 RepID=A0A0G0XJ12_9BACT|nr:MAG: hypothetical protein UU83_C0018G0004 [Candidatus Jorgensenbacteria bacterium GW2011_GWF2_41_8]OGM99336.1 MAG: hypothetical protein A2736_01695 [Candidatus Yanofskybacteria bacterium RIFCSPHIGHO2_01_FULL_41_27]